MRLACQRHLDDLERSGNDWPYRFDGDAAEKFCRFIELMPHTKGRWAARHEKLIMEPWQCFKTVSLFGWLRKRDGLRRFRSAVLLVARKNGKSPWAAAVGLAMLTIDGEFGAEVYSGATGEKQAHEVFTPARLMVKRTPELEAAYGITVGKKNLHISETGSKFEPVVGNPGDGPAPSCGLVDEYHEHSTSDLFDTFMTGMVGREQPLMIVISTAGSDLSGPCYAAQVDLQNVLEGTVKDETLFGVIYTKDEEDAWDSIESLEKANPNIDVSVSRETLLHDLEVAKRDSRKQNIYKIKHLNMWVQARTAWMNMEWWHRQTNEELRIEDFQGEPCDLAIDIAHKIDITSAVLVFERKEEFFVFGRHYLPEDTVADPAKQAYHGWQYDGHLTVTDGSRIDMEKIELDVLKDIERFDVREIAYDPWGGTYLEQRLTAQGAPMVEYRQTVDKMSPAMKEFEALVKEGKLWHDGNPILTWMISNVVGREDAKGNVYPRKERPENKIDGAVAAIMAIGRAMVSEKQGSVYEERGVLAI